MNVRIIKKWRIGVSILLGGISIYMPICSAMEHELPYSEAEQKEEEEGSFLVAQPQEVRSMQDSTTSASDTTDDYCLRIIKQFLAEGDLANAQCLIRKELEVRRTITFYSWLQENAFIKGDLVLLYEFVRYTLITQRNMESLQAGLKGLLILLIRTHQDVSVMNSSIVKKRDWIDLAQQMRKKVKCWWVQAELHGLAPSIQYPSILQKVTEWFDDQPKKEFCNPAAAAAWNLSKNGYLSYALSFVRLDPIKRVGIQFNVIPAELTAAVTQTRLVESIAATRATVATFWLEQCAKYKSWDAFFASTIFDDSRTAEV